MHCRQQRLALCVCDIDCQLTNDQTQPSLTHCSHFWRNVFKMVRLVLSDRYPVLSLSVCDVGVLWPKLKLACR